MPHGGWALGPWVRAGRREPRGVSVRSARTRRMPADGHALMARTDGGSGESGPTDLRDQARYQGMGWASAPVPGAQEAPARA